jgi:hypothetical protein
LQANKNEGMLNSLLEDIENLRRDENPDNIEFYKEQTHAKGLQYGS